MAYGSNNLVTYMFVFFLKVFFIVFKKAKPYTSFRGHCVLQFMTVMFIDCLFYVRSIKNVVL